jgi:hypothetical protein
MTDTVDSVIQDAFTVVRDVGGPLFTERGFVDVASRFSGATSLGGLLEAFDYAEQVCACPEVVQAGFHELRTAFERIKKVKDAGGTDLKTLGFARLQIISAANFFQDARNGRTSFEDAK